MNPDPTHAQTAPRTEPFIMDFAEAVANEATLRTALEAADVAPLAMVLAHLSGDATLLEDLRPYIHGAWNFMEDVPPELKQKVREALVVTLKRYATEALPPPPAPSRELLRTIMEVCVGQTVPDEYIPMILATVRTVFQRGSRMRVSIL